MSGKMQLFFEFERGPRAIATLQPEFAPRTCETIWGALAKPVTSDAMHAIYAGPGVIIGLPEAAQTFDPEGIPPENQAVIPAPGDVRWYYQRPMQMGGLPFEMWELGVFYGRGVRPFGPLGWTPVNIFGRITEGFDEFAAAAAGTRISGVRKITVGRV